MLIILSTNLEIIKLKWFPLTVIKFVPQGGGEEHLSFYSRHWKTTSRLEPIGIKFEENTTFSKAFINFFPPKLQRTKVISVLFADIKRDVSIVTKQH